VVVWLKVTLFLFVSILLLLLVFFLLLQFVFSHSTAFLAAPYLLSFLPLHRFLLFFVAFTRRLCSDRRRFRGVCAVIVGGFAAFLQ
jgi:hypothetical protein